MSKHWHQRMAVTVMASSGLLGGCVANSSNPTVSASAASMDDTQAQVTLTLTNPGGRHLTIGRIEYELSHGEIGFPLASGAWTGDVDLNPGDRVEIPLLILFDSGPIEPLSGLLHLNGQLHHTDHTGFLGMRSMDLSGTPFRLDITAERVNP